MQFTSTRSRKNIGSAQAITQGISEDGGLFVPQSFPALTAEQLDRMTGMSYKERAVAILSLFLTDFSEEEIRRCVEGAYSVRQRQSCPVGRSRSGNAPARTLAWPDLRVQGYGAPAAALSADDRRLQNRSRQNHGHPRGDLRRYRKSRARRLPMSVKPKSSSSTRRTASAPCRNCK